MYFSLTMSSLQAIASKMIEHPNILDIFIHYNNLLSKNHNLIFCWIPSHTGITGNSRAKEAKLALNSVKHYQFQLQILNFISISISV